MKRPGCYKCGYRDVDRGIEGYQVARIINDGSVGKRQEDFYWPMSVVWHCIRCREELDSIEKRLYEEQ